MAGDRVFVQLQDAGAVLQQVLAARHLLEHGAGLGVDAVGGLALRPLHQAFPLQVEAALLGGDGVMQLGRGRQVELAGRRARQRAADDAARTRDAYERDGGLQQRTGAVYAQLAAAGWAGPWLTLGPETVPADVAASLSP